MAKQLQNHWLLESHEVFCHICMLNGHLSSSWSWISNSTLHYIDIEATRKGLEDWLRVGWQGRGAISLLESNSNPNLITALFASLQHLVDAGANEISHSTHLCPSPYFRDGGASDISDRDREHGGAGIPPQTLRENPTTDLRLWFFES